MSNKPKRMILSAGEIEKGMFITAVRQTPAAEADEANRPRNIFGIPMGSSRQYMGDAFHVRAINIPYIVAEVCSSESYTTNRSITLDTRMHDFMELTDDFVEALGVNPENGKPLEEEKKAEGSDSRDKVASMMAEMLPHDMHCGHMHKRKDDNEDDS